LVYVTFTFGCAILAWRNTALSPFPEEKQAGKTPETRRKSLIGKRGVGYIQKEEGSWVQRRETAVAISYKPSSLRRDLAAIRTNGKRKQQLNASLNERFQ
jgi:hypothetical protein